MNASLRILRWVGHEIRRLAADRLVAGLVVFGGGVVLILLAIAPADAAAPAAPYETWARSLREPAPLLSLVAGMIGANWVGGDLGYGILRQGILGGATRRELLMVRVLTIPVVALALAVTQLVAGFAAALLSQGVALPAPDGAGWGLLLLHVARLSGLVALGAVFGAILRSPLLAVIAFLAWAILVEPGARVLARPAAPAIEYALPAHAFSSLGADPGAREMRVMSPGGAVRRVDPPRPRHPALPLVHGVLLSAILAWRILRKDL